MGTKNKKYEEVKSILISNEIITTSEDPVEVSIILNKFFTTIGSHLGSKIKQSSNQFFEHVTKESFDKVFNKIISTYEVLLML